MSVYSFSESVLFPVKDFYDNFVLSREKFEI